MSLPYETSTAGEKALSELQRALAKFGCQTFGTMTDAERGCTIVQFKWRGRTISLEASWKGYASAWLKAHPYKFSYAKSSDEHQRKAMAQAQISICSVLRDWVKGQIIAVECGVMSFDCAFLPHMLLGDGRRVAEKIASDNLLPVLADEKVVPLLTGARDG